MAQSLMVYEWAVRLAVFAGVFVAMALWELGLPRRQLTVGRLGRWPGNLGVVAIDTVVVRILFPTAAVGVALICERRSRNGIALLSGDIISPPLSAVAAPPFRLHRRS